MDKLVMRQAAWIGDEYLHGPARAVVLNFHGLGGGSGKNTPSTEELRWAQAGAVVAFPYCGPWSWMNRQAQVMTDDLVDAIYREFALSDDAPLVCTGGSMGGQASLLYTRYARRPVAACLANCPVCDMKFHFTERPDLPSTMRHAFNVYEGDIDAVLEHHSPLHQVAALPDIPYMILHGQRDTAVNKARHSDAMVAAMRARDLGVEYLELPEMGHCWPMTLEAFVRQIEFVLDAMNRK